MGTLIAIESSGKKRTVNAREGPVLPRPDFYPPKVLPEEAWGSEIHNNTGSGKRDWGLITIMFACDPRKGFNYTPEWHGIIHCGDQHESAKRIATTRFLRIA